MTLEEFESLVAQEFERAIPEQFLPHIKNVAFLVEEESEHGDLLGFYHGIPTPERGDWYGMGTVLPDTITLYKKTIEQHAQETGTPLEQVIRETIWHEVAHHFGMEEDAVRKRESLKKVRDLRDERDGIMGA